MTQRVFWSWQQQDRWWFCLPPLLSASLFTHPTMAYRLMIYYSDPRTDDVLRRQRLRLYMFKCICVWKILVYVRKDINVEALNVCCLMQNVQIHGKHVISCLCTRYMVDDGFQTDSWSHTPISRHHNQHDGYLFFCSWFSYYVMCYLEKGLVRI